MGVPSNSRGLGSPVSQGVSSNANNQKWMLKTIMTIPEYPADAKGNKNSRRIPDPIVSVCNKQVIVEVPYHVYTSVSLFTLQGKIIKKIYKGEMSLGRHAIDLKYPDLSRNMYFIRTCIGQFVVSKLFAAQE